MTGPAVAATLFLSLLGVQTNLAKPAKTPAATAAVYVSPELGLHGRTAQTALDEPFPDTYSVTVKSAGNEQRTLKNCTDLLSLGDAKYTAGSSQDDSNLRALGAKCFALDWIKNAKPAARSSFAHFTFRQVLARQLPPQFDMAISNDEVDAVAKAAKEGQSILAVAPDAKLHPLSADKAKLVTADWSSTLTVYAHGDFLGDGAEQLLLRWDASATGGSYINTQVFLLSQGKAGLVVTKSR